MTGWEKMGARDGGSGRKKALTGNQTIYSPPRLIDLIGGVLTTPSKSCKLL